MPNSSADPNAYVALAMQAAKGTPQATATKFRFMKYLSGTNVTPEITAQDIREGGDGLDWGVTYKQSQKMTGQLVFNARPEMLGQILQFTPGMATWDGASAPANHVFSTIGASHGWATIELAYPGTITLQTISDVRFTGFTIEGMAGEPLKITAPFVGLRQNASSAGIAPTYIAEEFFKYYQAPSYILDGTADTTIESWKIEVAYGIEELSAQAVQLDEAVVQNRDLSFEVVRRFEDRVLYNKIYTGAGGVPTTSVATGSFRAINLYGAGATLRTIDFSLPLISYRAGDLTEVDPDGKTIRQTLSGKGLKGATAALVVNLTNGHASAYAP